MRKVLLIGLVGFAITGCRKSQAPQICVPALPGWSTEQTGKPVSVITNVVALRGREILWNGHPINEPTFSRYVRETATMNPIPFYIFDPGKASDCSFAQHVRDTIDQEMHCRDGGCWQGSKEAFDRAPYKKSTGNAVP